MKSIHSLDKTIKQYNNMKQDLIKKIILTRTLEIQKLSKNELVMNLVSITLIIIIYYLIIT